MANKNIAYTQHNNRNIYVLIFQSINSVYIGQATLGSVRAEYNRHMLGKITKTKDYVKDERPCLFILETIYETKVKAYHLQIVWSKIFKDMGYQILDKSLDEYSNKLTDENYQKYQDRKNKNLELNCQNCIVKTYKNIKCERGEFNGESF